MPRRRSTPAPAGSSGTLLGAMGDAAATWDAMIRNREEHERIAAAAGALPHWRQYADAASSENLDRSALGRPIPLLLLGFGGSAGGGRSLATALVREIMRSRQQLSDEFGVHCPVLGISDGAGSFSPHQRMPYEFAILAGLSDAGMMQVAVEPAEAGQSLRGNGYSNTKDVVEHGGHKRCVLLDLSQDKRAATKALPGLLLGGQQGYFAVVIGKRPEAQAAAVGRAYPPERLLQLAPADLDAAAPAELAGADPLQKRAAGLLRRLVAWYLERPEVQREAEATSALGSDPIGRREHRQLMQELEATGAACPCGCGEKEVREHMAGIMTVALAHPEAALRRFERGDASMGMAIGNLVGVGVGSTEAQQNPQVVERYGGSRLLAATTAQLVAARQQRNYPLWRAALLLVTNLTRFAGPLGDGYRNSLLEQGLVQELIIAEHSKDVAVRGAADSAITGLEKFDTWQRRCSHCSQPEGDSVKLLLCARCRSRPYCQRECQVAAWPSHKAECKQLEAL